MNPEIIFSPLVDLLLKSTAVLALAMSMARLLRRASAASRHLVLLAAFILLLLLPLTKMAAPRWGLRIPLPRVETPATGEASPSAGLSFSEKRSHWLALDLNWRSMAVAGWLAGIVLLLGYRVAGSLQFRAFQARSRLVNSDRVISLARRIAGENPINVELRESDTAQSPLTWGIWRPAILLPFGAEKWSDEHLIAALLHEWGHIRRRDCLARLLAQMASAIFWVNPLVWMAMRRLRLEQEIACDDMVLGAGIGATDYANQLVTLVRSLRWMPANAPHALAMANPSTLETRVRAIVEGRQDRRPLTRVAIAAAVVGAAAMLMLFTFAQVRAADNPPSNDAIQHDKTPANPTGVARPAAFGDTPIEITSLETRMENGIAICTGEAVLKWRTVTIKGDVIKYNPDTRVVTVISHGQIEAGGDGVIHGDYLVYNLETQKLISKGAR